MLVLPPLPPQPQGGVVRQATRAQGLLLVLTAATRPSADDVIVGEPAPSVWVRKVAIRKCHFPMNMIKLYFYIFSLL